MLSFNKNWKVHHFLQPKILPVLLACSKCIMILFYVSIIRNIKALTVELEALHYRRSDIEKLYLTRNLQ